MSPAERADAARNRAAILGAADKLFASSDAPETISMDDVAQAAGVGKGTLFRRFGDRQGLLHEVYGARIAPLRAAIETGPAPLGPGTPSRERILAILDAFFTLKLENGHLARALEQGSPRGETLYGAPAYRESHLLLSALLRDLDVGLDPEWTAHILLAAVRSDLIDHVARDNPAAARAYRAHLRSFIQRTIG